MSDRRDQENIVPFKTAKPTGGNGSGGGYDDLRDRITRLEKRTSHLATKEDIQKVKVWILAGVLGGIIATSTVLTGTVLFAIRLLIQ